jgi:transposase InsO family protein
VRFAGHDITPDDLDLTAGIGIRQTHDSFGRRKVLNLLRRILVVNFFQRVAGVKRIATGRGLRILTLVDSFTRECPAIEVNTGLAGVRVTRVLERVIAERGRPRTCC